MSQRTASNPAEGGHAARAWNVLALSRLVRAWGVTVLFLICLAAPRDAGAARLPRARTQLERVRAAATRPLPRRPRRKSARPARLVRPAPPPASKIQAIRRAVSPNRRMSDLSIAGLTAAGAPGVDGAARINLPLSLDVFTGVGGLALSIASIVDYRRAIDGPGRADAAHGLAWGLQSIGAITAYVASTPWLATASAIVGVAGGVLQTGVGLFRLKDGIARRERRVTILGGLDVVAGVSWVASTVSYNPVALGVFLAATGARVVYANSALLHRLAGNARRKLSSRRTAAAGTTAD